LAIILFYTILNLGVYWLGRLVYCAEVGHAPARFAEHFFIFIASWLALAGGLVLFVMIYTLAVFCWLIIANNPTDDDDDKDLP
jgi:hypothetical protein